MERPRGYYDPEMCAPCPPGVVGEVAPRALGSANPHPRGPATPSVGSRQGRSVCPRRESGQISLSPQRAQSKEAARALRIPGRSFPGPRTSDGAPPADPGPSPLPQVAAGIVLVVVLGLRVPEQHGWGSEPGPTQARGGRDARRPNL